MEFTPNQHTSTLQKHALALDTCATENQPPILTRFGDIVDVRRRGALRMGRFAGTQTRTQTAPAVVRLWNEDRCRELSAHQARSLAAQLLEAATMVDAQNGH